MSKEQLVVAVQEIVEENELLKQQVKALEAMYKKHVDEHHTKTRYIVSHEKGEEGMKLNEYQKISERTMPKKVNYGVAEKFSDMSKSNYALGLCGEAGELGEVVKKHVHHDHAFNRDKFIKEAGDVLHYLAGICTMYEVTLEEIATMNIHKLGIRYKDGFSSKASNERKDEFKELW